MGGHPLCWALLASGRVSHPLRCRLGKDVCQLGECKLIGFSDSEWSGGSGMLQSIDELLGCNGDCFRGLDPWEIVVCWEEVHSFPNTCACGLVCITQVASVVF